MTHSQQDASTRDGISLVQRSGVTRCFYKAALALALAALLLNAPAAADWLVTVEGELIETKGTWEERGRAIVYTDLQGNLVSLRSSQIDLEESRELTEKAPALFAAEAEARVRANEQRAAAAEAAKSKPASVVITNNMVGGAKPVGPKILMYSAEWCGQCKRARRKLDALGADYYEKDIDRVPGAKAALRSEIGRVAVPHIRFDKTGQRGFETTLTGYLASTLEAMVTEQKAVGGQNQ